MAAAVISFECAYRSDAGLRRANNEDTVLVDESLGLVLVCDGVGGHAAGEVASRAAAAEIQRFFCDSRPMRSAHRDEASAALESALRCANERVLTLAGQNSEWSSMGSTCVALLLAEDSVVVGYAGDSRCYRLDDGGVVRLTTDHTTDEIARRFFEEEDGAQVRGKRQESGLLVQALGKDPAGFRATISVHPAKAGDIFLLCSDGLTDEVADDEVASTALRGGALEDICASLVALANQHGGRDNISVAMLRVKESTAPIKAVGAVVSVSGLVYFELADLLLWLTAALIMIGPRVLPKWFGS